MTRCVLTLLGGLAAFVLPSSLPAAVVPKKSTPHVVLVGISDYKDPQIKDRKYAETDVKALYDLFTNPKHFGVENENVRLLLGKPDKARNSKPATRENILAALEWLTKEDDTEDLAIFVFIGQGGPLANKAEELCYFASDTTFKERGATGVAAADIGEKLKELRSRHFCAFVDINFKGYTTKDTKIPEAKLGRTPYQELLGDDGSRAHGSVLGRVLFLATNGLSQSLDLEKNGLFTEVLLKGLKGEADKEGYEADGRVTIKELGSYITAQVHAQALKHGKTFREKRQVAYILGDSNDRFTLTFNPEVRSKALEQIKQLEALAKKGEISEELLEEGKALLEIMPGVKERQALRQEYQKLLNKKTTVAKLKKTREKIIADLKVDSKVTEAFAKRLMEATKILTDDYFEKLNQADLIAWAVRGLYRQLSEPLPADVSEKLNKVRDLKEGELRSLLVDARKHLGNREELRKNKDQDIAIARMMRKLDPYSTYISPETKQEFEKGTTGEFVGIGVQVRTDEKTRMLLVVTPLKGGPAFKKGIKAGDIISEIIREVDSFGKKLDKVEVIPTKDLSISDAVKKITGKQGTKVKLKIQRKGNKEPFVVELARDQIQVETVMGARRRPDTNWDFMLDEKNKIGYIRLTQFNPSSAGEMQRAMRDLKKQKLKGLVLDLRFNPGGLLYSAREIADLFINDGLIVTIKPRKGRERKIPGFSEGSYLDFPMTCLVNGSSASGSEIVAAALQDHGRAIVVGSRSFGKGSVQNINNFGSAQIKITTATFWRPNGVNLNKASTKGRDEDDWGVKPDAGYSLPLSRLEQRELLELQQSTEVIHPKDHAGKPINLPEKDRQLQLALNYLEEQIKLGEKAKGK